MRLGKFDSFKKILTAFVLVVGLVFSISYSAFGGVVYASSGAFENPITNPTFKQRYNTEYISGLDGWSNISYDGYSENSQKDRYQSGAVKASSVTNSKKNSLQRLWDDFSLIEDPGKVYQSDDSIYDTYLMMSSSRAPGRIGYQTSSDFTLDANSFYRITVTLKTFNNISSPTEENLMIEDQGEDGNKVPTVIENNAFASIYIKGLSDDSFTSLSKFENVSTQNQWGERTFLISTTAFSNEKIRLELWLGGEKITDTCQGAIFFNDVNVERLSHTFYYDEVEKANDIDRINVIDLDTNPYITHLLTNPSFEQDWSNGWAQLPNQIATKDDKISVENLSSGSYHEKGISSPNTNNTTRSNRNALFIYLEEKGFLGISSQAITIKAGAYYRLSVWTVSDCGIGEGATVRLVERDNNGNRLLNSAKTLTTPTTIANKNNNRNGWLQYNFYIQGSGLVDKELYLELSLGTEETLTNGYVFFDDVSLQQISHTNFLKASIDSSTEIAHLENSPEELFMIKNPSFNHISQTGIEQAIYPAVPNAWTFDKQSEYENDYHVNGVINTNPYHFNENKHYYYSSMPNPGKVKYHDINNVLVMGSLTTSDVLTYTSDSFTLDKNSTYYLSLYFNSHLLDSNQHNSEISVKVLNDNLVVSEHNFADTNGFWQQLAFEINTGLTNGSFTIQLTFSNTKGYIFFDDFFLTNTPHLTEKHAISHTINLNKNTFSSFNNWQTSSTGQHNYSGVTKGNLSFLEFNGVDINDITYFDDGNLSALYILNQTTAITTTQSTNTFSLLANEYYKISVWIKTSLLETDPDNENIGAYFAIKYGDTTHEINGIVKNHYTNYSFYINPDTNADVKVVFGLGYEEAETLGIAFFDCLEITTFESKKQFEENQTDIPLENLQVITAITSEDDHDHDHDHDDDHDHDHDHHHVENIWMAASGIITAVAIFIAMIGAALRKINWRRPAKKVSTSYDRRKTLNKSLSRQELITLHNQLIKEVDEELIKETQQYQNDSEVINTEIQLIKQKIKDDTSELKKEYRKLEKEKDKHEMQLNEKLAENKQGTSLKDDRECQKQIASINSLQKKVQKQIDKIQNKYNAEIYKLEALLAAIAQKPKQLEQEIKQLKKDVEKIKAEEKSVALKTNKK